MSMNEKIEVEVYCTASGSTLVVGNRRVVGEKVCGSAPRYKWLVHKSDILEALAEQPEQKEPVCETCGKLRTAIINAGEILHNIPHVVLGDNVDKEIEQAWDILDKARWITDCQPAKSDAAKEARELVKSLRARRPIGYSGSMVSEYWIIKVVEALLAKNETLRKGYRGCEMTREYLLVENEQLRKPPTYPCINPTATDCATVRQYTDEAIRLRVENERLRDEELRLLRRIEQLIVEKHDLEQAPKGGE